MNIPIVIPVYNPPELFASFLRDVRMSFSEPIVVVNDGSHARYKNLFATVRKFPRTTVLTHAQNEGKGAALKTAMKHVRVTMQDLSGILTIDADGQHTTDDIRRALAFSRSHPNQLVIGTRLPRHRMPLRSRVGNAITRFFLHVLHGRFVTDTQSGLRYIPTKLVDSSAQSIFNKYDFELDMLIRALYMRMQHVEFPIAPVYINKNKSSHYRTFLDSWFVARVFFHHFSRRIGIRKAMR